MIVWLLLRRFSLRHWRLAPGQNALLVLILALGVAVFTAIHLANQSAVASFGNFTETLVGTSDWVIEAPAGLLPESVLPELRAALGTRPVAIVPVVETTAGRPLKSGDTAYLDRETYTVLGLDLIGISNLAGARSAAGSFIGSRTDFWGDFRAGPRIWVPPILAKERSLNLVIGDAVIDLPVAGVLPTAPDAPAFPDNLLVMDLPQLQALADKAGRVDRIEFAAAPGPRLQERRAELGAILTRLGREGERWTVRTPGVRRETAEKMTAAFRLNLAILSLIALLVGLYLILQALDGAVVRRRGEIAILRSLGVEESTIRQAWLGEAALLGLLGGTVGLFLGWLAAQGAVRVVGRTFNALYFATTVNAAALRTNDVWTALLVGVGASVAAGWWPAREAARTPPAQILVRSGAPAIGARLWRSPVAGLVLLAAGIGLARLPPLRFAGGVRFPLAGYSAALAWIVGGGIGFASALPVLAASMRRLGVRSAVLRVTVGHLSRPSSRHRLATAALLCAIGMSAGMAILVSSFEQTVRGWVGRALQADIYLYSAGARSASAENRIPAATWRALSRHPGVAQAWVLADYPLQWGDGAPALLSGTDLELIPTRADLPWVAAPRDGAVFDPARNSGLALVSESFSDRFNLRRGGLLGLPTPAGVKSLVIAGIFSDYGNERGTVMVERQHLAEWLGDDSATNLSLFLRPGINPETFGASLSKEYPGLRIFTHSALRSQILRIFRQTFSITYALEIIGVVVAVAGLALAMTSVLLDRREELTTLRALGFTQREIAWAASIEGAVLALWSVVGGLALSLALGWLLIHVINKQSFGWTLGFAIPGRRLAVLAAMVTATGWAVSYAVGLWSADLPADREE
jgi:putative ABC transport system permease protein